MLTLSWNRTDHLADERVILLLNAINEIKESKERTKENLENEILIESKPGPMDYRVFVQERNSGLWLIHANSKNEILEKITITDLDGFTLMILNIQRQANEHFRYLPNRTECDKTAQTTPLKRRLEEDKDNCVNNEENGQTSGTTKCYRLYTVTLD